MTGDALAKVLNTAADAAAGAFAQARQRWAPGELSRTVGIGGDGTPTSRLDQIVDEAVLAAVDRLAVNVLSEEAGWVDRGSAVTLAVDPVDGTANALAGVPLCTFSAAVVVDGEPVGALTRWLDGGRDWLCWNDQPGGGPWATTGRRRLQGAAVSLLRPQPASRTAWYRISEQASRVRVLSCSTLEAVLVCTGATDAFVDAGADVHRYVDLVAAVVYARAAGATVADGFGRPVEFDTDLTRRWSGVVAASPELAEQLQAVIAAAKPEIG
jgi:myo-inositol-1(or 4)-monophosphatase